MPAEPRDHRGLPVGRAVGREAFAQTVRDALACAADEGWRELILSDASFEDWPLHERAVVDSLHAWARAGRRFTMLASRYEIVQRQQPRFVSWRQTWGHLIECRLCAQIDPLDFPSALWSPVWVMQRLDIERCVFVTDCDASRRVNLRQLLDEAHRNSSPGFPSTILGL